jgi:ABC-type transport system substrate-binding protein
MNGAMQQDMKNIGIVLEFNVMDWAIWIYDPKLPWENDLWYTGWGLNYLDPFNMLEPLLNNMSIHNHLRNNDYLIPKWLKQYEETDLTNTEGRAKLLYKIQQRAINEFYVLLPISFEKTYYIHHRSLGGVSYNIQRNL